MKLYPIHISNFKIDGGAMFGVVPKVLWEKQCPADERNLCDWSLRSLLVDTGKRVILIDNGYGDKQGEKFFSHVYLNGGYGLEGALKNFGYALEDITDVFLTHLHSDHCGGGTKWNKEKTGYELTFPNADYYVSRMQWESAINPNVREADAYPPENLLPMMESGKLKLIEKEGELFPGFEVRFASGHTPGQMIPVIDYNGRKVVFGADLFPSVAHIPLLWNMSYELDPLLAIDEKRRMLDELVQENGVLFFQHDLNTECCTLVQTPKGVRAGEKFSLSEL